MYITRFLDSPTQSFVYLYGDNQYDENVQKTIDDILSKLNRFVYLIDAYTIVKDSSFNLTSVRAQDNFEFWKVNQCLLNYLNAVFCYHEYINHYKPSLDNIANQYWYIEHGKYWFRFVCEYRDRVVHQSIIIKDYDRRNGILYVNLDELVLAQEHIIETEKRKKYKERAQRFLDLIIKLRNSAYVGKNGQHYYRMSEIVSYADQEIEEMSQKVFIVTYRHEIKITLDQLLNLVHFEDEENKPTYIVDSDNNECIFEPTAAIEWFYAKILHSLGINNEVCKNVGKLLKLKGFCRFYEDYPEIKELLGRADIH